MKPPVTVSNWTKWVLISAAWYNLLWGAAIVFFPTVPFAWAGLEPPNYLPILQCLGMVIGVYGIGYWIASRDPARHWAIVFVGLLGKILGPLGFLFYALRGELPWVLGLTILTNDLVWWLPFIAILVQAVRVNDDRRMCRLVDDLQSELRQTVGNHGVSLLDLSQKSPVLVIFLRHSGCTYCRETLSRFSAQQAALKQQGYELAIVHMSPPADGERMAKQYGLTSAHWFSDPERKLYFACDLRLGTLSELFGPYVFWRALVEGTVFRHGFGPIVGNGLQLSGAFVLQQGKIISGVRHKSSAEVTDFGEVCRV